MATPADSTKNISHSTSRSSVGAGIVLVIWATSIICGQLVRLPLFGNPPTGGGVILPSDIANVLVIVYAIVAPLAPDGERVRVRGKAQWALAAITPFLLWSLFVLCIHIGQLSGEEFIVALSYWIRLFTTLALLPSFFVIFQNKNNQKLLRPLILFLVIPLVVLGYIQLIVQPSLHGISGGWDPHNFRMVSTWLDPNFFGIFLVILLPYVVVGNSGKRLGLTLKPQALRRIAAVSIIFPAILLTQSRSTFIAIFVAGTICGILYLLRVRITPIYKKLVILGASLAIACIVLGIMLLGDRASNIFLHDPTVSIRSDAYKTVWRNLVEPNILLGVGYNAYQFAAKDAGVISDFTAHSRAGSDSSVLTLLVTTGIIGTALFFAPIFAAMAFHLRKFLQTNNLYSLCFLFVTLALLMQSQFTNSLLYPHILMVYMLLAAVVSPPSPVRGEGGGEGKSL